MMAKQHTIKGRYEFKGKGLHTGRMVTMVLEPAPVNHGVKFKRTDIGEDAVIDAVVDYVTTTARGTTLEKGDVKISTLEHLMATFNGLKIDNVLVSIDAQEVPILDGSALPYIEVICRDGLQEQDAERKVYDIKKKIHYRNEQTGSEITILPDDHFSVDLMIDFNSKVLGNQYARFDEATDFAKDIAPCRTFVFFHELEPLFKNNLIKGGDLDNAIVIVENPVPQEELDRLATLFGVHSLERAPEGYLNHLQLRFPNECSRHKLLDIFGDFSLVGVPFNGKVIAYKSGHGINTMIAKVIRDSLRSEIEGIA
ncbi:MAG: UDP-3-O-[Bacteroidales bacterium]|nr:UDP-3-O-[3-hydroxymyristoyl] N-acetylglucosamine deacetylase [Bacteroidales bacterium]